jgi:aspartyl-tRNA(Asn)/glutamyl-tRNA(Gln) amidotransferase subunit A
MGATELWQLAASDLVRAFGAGEASPTEALDACLDRIATCDAAVGAFTAVDEGRARQAAAGQERLYRRRRQGRRGPQPGPLAGVPVAVKELIEVAGLPFTGGSATRTTAVGQVDAPVVRALRQAGALVVGTTRTHELAWGITTQHASLGSTGNPWRLDRIPGGSSGGSAAAVAYGAVPLALGTDTGGSVRIPAGYCGVVGFKPTYGSLPLERVIPLARTFDHVGLLAREVDDVGLALDLMLDPALDPPATLPTPAGLRVGVPGVPAKVPLAAAVQDALDAATTALGGAVSVPLPDPAHIYDVYRVIQLVEALDVHQDTLGTWPGEAASYGADVRARLERATEVTPDEQAAARAALDRLRQHTLTALRRVDVVLQPCAAATASRRSEPDVVHHDGRPWPLRDVVLPCTVLHNMVGLPSCAVPAGLDEDGVPIGVQVAGRAGADPLVLAVAASLRDALRTRMPRWPTPFC